MFSYIKNEKELVTHGHGRLRKAALDIADCAIQAADPYIATRKLVGLQGDILSIGSLRFDLSQQGNVYILGAGKASLPIAKALDEILGDRISSGLVIVKNRQNRSLQHIELREASHPVPDKTGLAAAEEMMRLAGKAREGDLAFCAITGGSSALMPLPVSSVNLQDKRKVNELMLACGANIREINAVRKHLSDIKGGRLALSLFPAEIVNLTVSDVIGDPLDYITDPTVPDTSTFSDAIAVLDKYSLWDDFPESAIQYLRNASPELETPKDFGKYTDLVHSFILATGDCICKSAVDRARELGFTPWVLTVALEGESKEEGTAMARLACRVKSTGSPLSPPCALIAAGETTVTISGKSGRGGPNQEFVLSAALQLAEHDGIVIAALDTDGSDGPTDIAGGLVDNSTISRARETGLEPVTLLSTHDASSLLLALGDTIITGPTGTNVNDLKIALVGNS
jgi:glycerate 2-kinase